MQHRLLGAQIFELVYVVCYIDTRARCRFPGGALNAFRLKRRSDHPMAYHVKGGVSANGLSCEREANLQVPQTRRGANRLFIKFIGFNLTLIFDGFYFDFSLFANFNFFPFFEKRGPFSNSLGSSNEKNALEW